jgi:RNA polymerase primary sigma factor
VDGDSLFSEDPLRVYLAELNRVPPLDRAEEMECIQHIRAGDEQAEEAGKRLVEANLRLVVTIAERHAHDQIHILDLIQDGNCGLVTAIHTLRESLADDFAMHATPFIERAISEARLATRVKMVPPHLL